MVKTIKNVKSIKFNVNFNGQGCVNFDSNEQSFFLNNKNLYKSIYNNITYSKKIFKFDDDDNIVFKHKVSSECLRNAIYKSVIPFQNPSVKSNPLVLYSIISQPGYILRGYMTPCKGGNTIRKKSPFTITDAIEMGPWRTNVIADIHTQSGYKDVETKEEDDQKDTSLYKIENVGNNTYEASGFIDVSELQFISADPLYDRMAVENTDDVTTDIYLKTMKEAFPSFEPEFDYYAMHNSYVKDEWSEIGILLDNSCVDSLIKQQLKMIADVSIKKRNAYLEFDKFTSIIVKTTEGDIEIDFKDIDDYTFEYAPSYYKADADKVQKNIEIANEFKKSQKKLSKKNKK